MIPGRKYAPEDVVRLAWRHKWLILLPFALVGTATVVVSDRLPNQYLSETLILIVPQRIPTEYVRSTVTARIEDRLQTISQQILSRTRLERIIEDLDLYREEVETTPMEDIVQRMRGQIGVQSVEGDDSRVSAFRISYEAEDPRVAMLVTERLAALFIDENLRDREVLARSTSTFLESQLEDARQRLVEHEQKLEEYKRRYSGELPSQLPTNLQVIQSLQLQLQSVMDSLNRDRDRLLLVGRSLADLSSEVAILAASSVVGGDGTNSPQDAPAAVRLLAAGNALRTLELRLTPDHPDFVRTKRLIEDLEKEVLQEQKVAEESQKVRAEEAQILSQADAARHSRLRELDAERDMLERQIAYRLAEEQRLQERITEYQARVEKVPARESELVALARDYDTLQRIYETLLAKREDSKIAENLERRQISEQFKVLDPARLPERPIRPDRLRINLMGAAAGLFLGLAFVGLLEYRDQSLRTEADVRAVRTVPVLTLIPVLVSRAERWRARLATFAFSLIACAVIVACAAIVLVTLR
jgi:polysaccharide chain length determinant protein (PEP-CTERM system associated)